MSKPHTPTYKTLNWPAYNKARKGKRQPPADTFCDDLLGLMVRVFKVGENMLHRNIPLVLVGGGSDPEGGEPRRCPRIDPPLTWL